MRNDPDIEQNMFQIIEALEKLNEDFGLLCAEMTRTYSRPEIIRIRPALIEDISDKLVELGCQFKLVDWIHGFAKIKDKCVFKVGDRVRYINPKYSERITIFNKTGTVTKTGLKPDSYNNPIQYLAIDWDENNISDSTVLEWYAPNFSLLE
jgi:hypothetical protein